MTTKKVTKIDTVLKGIGTEKGNDEAIKYLQDSLKELRDIKAKYQ